MYAALFYNSLLLQAFPTEVTPLWCLVEKKLFIAELHKITINHAIYF